MNRQELDSNEDPHNLQHEDFPVERVTNAALTPVSTGLKPFAGKSDRLKNWYDLGSVIEKVFDAEAARLGIKPERFEYSNLNELYKPAASQFSTHYYVFDPGSPSIRGFLGNVVGRRIKEDTGEDIGHLFEGLEFNLGQILFVAPGVDIGGYETLHAFLTILNKELINYHLVVAYLRYHPDFNGGFHDHLGLIRGVAGTGEGQIVAGDVELDPTSKEEVEGKTVLFTSVKGGVLQTASIASCYWDPDSMEHLQAYLDEGALAEMPEDLPLKDRLVDTFHFLNGVTPHYIKEQLVEAFRLLKTFDQDE